MTLCQLVLIKSLCIYDLHSYITPRKLDFVIAGLTALDDREAAAHGGN